MKPHGLEILTISEVKDYITNVAEGDLQEDFATGNSRGFRTTRPGLIGEADYGTIFQHSTYPTFLDGITTRNYTIYDHFNLYIPQFDTDYPIIICLDNTGGVAVTAASNATPIQITAASHGFVTGDKVLIRDVGGNSNANGIWQITFVDANNFTLDGIVGNGAYTTGGVATKNPKMKIFVYDGGWIELTQTSTGVITSASGTAIGYTTSDTIADLSNWILVNESSASPATALIVSGSSNGATGSIVLVNNYNATGLGTSFNVGQSVKLYRCTGILQDAVQSLNSLSDSNRGYKFNNGATPHIRSLPNELQNKVTMFYGDSKIPTTARQQLQIRKGSVQTPNSFMIGGGGWTFKTELASGGTITGVSVVGRAITSIDDTLTPIKITLTAHGFSGGETVFISGVTGDTAINGKWVITLAGANAFTLNGSSGASIASSGGVLEYAWVTDGAKLYFSRDGGDTWTTSSTTGSYRVRFVDYNNGWAVGPGGSVYVTTNGGATSPSWTSKNTGTIGTTNLSDVSVVDATHVYVCGYAAGAAKVFFTSDGGTTWTDISTGLTFLTQAFGIFARNSTNKLWVTGTGAIYFSSNNGTTWTNQTPALQTMTSIKFFDDNTGWATGFSGYLLKTTNGGSTWIAQTVPTSSSLNEIKVVDATHARIAVSPGGVISTSDGSTWTTDTFPPYPHRNCIDLVDFTDGYACGNLASIIRLTGGAGAKGSGAITSWYVDKAGLLPDFIKLGTQTLNRAVPLPPDTVDIGEGLRMTLTYQEETDSGVNAYYCRMYVTALYVGLDGVTPYQESDPILQVFLSSLSGKFPSAKIQVLLDLARVNKNLYGFNFYEARKASADFGGHLANWIDDAAEYLLAYQLLYSSPGWAIDTSNQYSYSNTVNQFTLGAIDLAYASNPGNIEDNLNHGVQLSRSYLTSRFGVKTARDEQAVYVVDQDDRFLRLSSQDGAGENEDDNFPNIVEDNTGFKQKKQMTARGILSGLAIVKDVIVAMRETEADLFDLQSAEPNLIGVDFYAPKSLTSIGNPDNMFGLGWTGKSGIYFMPVGHVGAIMTLSLGIANRIDGSQMTDDTVTPFITDSYRKNMICGFDPTYKEMWVHTQINLSSGTGSEFLCYRINFDNNKRISVRQLNLSTQAVKFFSSKKDGSFTVGVTNGLLKYPNRNTTANSHAFEDEVSFAGVSASRGIPKVIRINCGSLHKLNLNAALWDIVMDYFGITSSINNMVGLNLYANGEITTFDPKTFDPAVKGFDRMITEHGPVETLEIEIVFPTTNLYQFKRFDLNQIEIGYIKKARVGNI